MSTAVRILTVLSLLLPTAVPAKSTVPAGPDQPLISAVRAADHALLDRQLESGADPEATDPLGRKALHYAAALGDTHAIASLLANGARVDPSDGDGFTPLMRAAQNGWLEATQVLLKSGADPNLRNHAEQTASELATANGHLTLRDLLD